MNSKQTILAIMNEFPELTDFGFQTGREDNYSINRDKMLEPRSLNQFEHARQWFSRFHKTKRLNKNHTSYGIKHVAALHIGFVTNGIFIAAAIAEGFDFNVDGDGPNVWFNIPEEACERELGYASIRGDSIAYQRCHTDIAEWEPEWTLDTYDPNGFCMWIMSRNITNTPRGDFIEDTQCAVRIGWYLGKEPKKWDDLESFLYSHGACGDAIKVGRQVWREWEKSHASAF